MAETLHFTTRVWTTGGSGPWHMVTLPERLSDEIDARYAGPKRGFGAVRVKARIGQTSWGTSIFPTRSTGAYIMGIKKAVRDAEGVVEGARVEIALDIPDLR